MARKHQSTESPNAPGREFRGFRLSPFQEQAVCALEAGENVLVAAPTGAGKTLVAEFAIAEAVRDGKRCIYTSPIKALSNQKYRDFRDDPEIDVGLMTGDVTLHPHAQVLIMTTEILRNAIFENAGLLDGVAYLVFDEVHFLDDPERGTVWEESLIFAPADMRILALSATVSNVEELGEWLREIRTQELTVVRSTKRPVPLEYMHYAESAGLFPDDKLNRVRKKLGPSSPGPSKFQRHGPRDQGRRGRRGQHGQRGHRDDVFPPDPGPVFDHLQNAGELPALCFAFSRKDCERLAVRNAGRDLLDTRERKTMENLQRELLELFQLEPGFFDDPLLCMARNGVSYHHAGMLPVHKELVERMFTSGLLKLLFTTETFALGINMPARTVLFYGLRKFDGVTFDYLRTRDFQQMAGRAGRQGIDDSGQVILLLSVRDLRTAPLERMLHGKAEPVNSRFHLGSSILIHLVETLGHERLPEAWEKSFDQYQHRSETEKRERKRRRAMRLQLDAHLRFLGALGYIRDDHSTGRGDLAKSISGYEVQVTELLFRGILENLPAQALAVVFVGLVYEERRRDAPPVPRRIFGDLRRDVDKLLFGLARQATDCGLETPLKGADWGLSPGVVVWMRGASLEEAAEAAGVTPGDLCRSFRQALQLIRQVQRATDPSWDIGERLADVEVHMNREEIDARRQLELG